MAIGLPGFHEAQYPIVMKWKAIIIAAVAAFLAPAEAQLYRGRESTLEILSERDPYALYGPRYYLPPSYYPRYFGARFCNGPPYGRPRQCYVR
jgi:hypothetical protein